MHESFARFINHAHSLALQKNLNWEFEIDSEGQSRSRWNLTELIGGTRPFHYLCNFGYDKKLVQLLNKQRAESGEPILDIKCLSRNWQDLIKAAACDQLLFRQNTPSHTSQQVLRPLRFIATLSIEVEPWDVSCDIIQKAFEYGKILQPSGGISESILGVVKTVFDINHLSKSCPIYPLLSANRRVYPSMRSRATKSKEQLLNELSERKRGERLPEKRAFWEMVRIVFTENPKTYTDAIRFSALKVMILCGLRIGETVMLPVDWKRQRDYFDSSGKRAGELGGISSALLLRHFAEKQQSPNCDSIVLVESTQVIPQMFEDILIETLDEATKITDPVRKTLRLQVETGRLLPWYGLNDLIPADIAYKHITGNPFWLDLPKKEIQAYVTRYQNAFDPSIFEEISNDQDNRLACSSMAMYMFFRRMKESQSSPKFLDKAGREVGTNEIFSFARSTFLRVGELEEYLKRSVPTKLPDVSPIKIQGGVLNPYELLFLLPKRSLSEERNGTITDISKCFSTGIPSGILLSGFLGLEKKDQRSLFRMYGETEEDKNLVIKSHSLRHLQNTELFRLGVADTIITKRYNRKSVVQSYEYDHRSLAEELESIDLPPEVEISLGSNASTVARLIKTGKATGPIVDSFKRIQKEEGDDAALEFLRVEADGFHATPYGHCINSFMVDPCPKHLECFAGCCHLTATDLPENRRHLKALEMRLQAALSEVTARPVGSIGRENQISHATVRLEAIQKLCSTPSGQIVFPDAPDLSLPSSSRRVLDVG